MKFIVVCVLDFGFFEKWIQFYDFFENFCTFFFHFGKIFVNNYLNHSNLRPNFRDNKIFGKCFKNSLSARIWVNLCKLELFRDVVLQWFEVFKFFYWEPTPKLGLDIEHKLISSLILPRIFPNYFGVECEQSGIGNVKNNPSRFFYGFLNENFLCGDLVTPYFGFCHEDTSIVRKSCMRTTQIELSEWDWVVQEKTPQSWQEFTCSADFFGSCHKNFGK